MARRQEPYDPGYQPTTPMNAATGIDRTLLLMRHAKSAWPDVPDHDRPLARRGQRDAPPMGRWLRAADHAPDQVICSTARRARETWQLTQAGLGVTPAVAFDNGVYQASAPQLLDLIRHASPEAGTLLVIGHDPAIPELALSLVSATAPVVAGVVRYAAPPAVYYRMREKFPTAAVAIFEFTGHWHQLSAGSAWLTWFVTPRDSMTLPVSAICTNWLDRPGNFEGFDSWEDAGSWRHSGSTRRSSGPGLSSRKLTAASGRGGGRHASCPPPRHDPAGS